MKWKQLKKGNDGIYRLDVTEDPWIASKSFRGASFLQLAFDRAEERMIATDTRGRVYQFQLRGFSDITYKIFEKLSSSPPPTCLAFNPLNNSEILLALTSNVVAVCKPSSEDSFVTSAQLSGHRYTISHITFYKHYCLTASSKEAIIWDLTTCAKTHQLKLESASGNLRKATFSKCGHVAALYSNDGLQIWSYEGFPGFTEESRIALRDFSLRNVKDFVFTRDGRAIVICAAKGGIRVVDTARFELMATFHLAEIPSIPKRISIIPHPLDAGASKMLAVYRADGSLQFLDLSNGNIVRAKQELCRGIRNFAVSTQGRWVARVEVNGSLGLCRVDGLFYGEEKPVVVGNRSKAHRTNHHHRSVKEDIGDELRLCKLLPILKEFGEYPEKHRMIIWSALMKLPMNREACTALTENVSENASIRNMLRKYPLQDQSKASLLATTADRLVRWCSPLGQCQFLPALVFPFLVVFQKNRLLALEASITVLTNFCEKWFEYYPLPPLNVLGIVENILLESDPELLRCFCERGVTSTDYAWPLLQTTLSEVFTAKEWLILWDHVLSYRQPSFLLMCVIAYSICCRETIISLLWKPEDFRKFYSSRGNLSVNKLLKVARRLDQNTPERIHPGRYLRNDFIVLPKEGPYLLTLMHEYPKFLIEEESALAKLGELQEEEKMLQEYHLRAIKIADEKRLRTEIDNFIEDVHRNRMSELRKFYDQQLRLTRYNVENTRDEIQQYTSTFGDRTLRSMELNRSSETIEPAHNNTRITPSPSSNMSSRSNNYNKLRHQVQDLESQVHRFLSAPRSRYSANAF